MVAWQQFQTDPNFLVTLYSFLLTLPSIDIEIRNKEDKNILFLIVEGIIGFDRHYTWEPYQRLLNVLVVLGDPHVDCQCGEVSQFLPCHCYKSLNRDLCHA
jgi:hypothetical protein